MDKEKFEVLVTSTALACLLLFFCWAFGLN